MKNIYKILGLLLLVAGTYSCGKDDLNLSPISEIGDNGFYTNDEEIEGAVIAIYDGLQAVPLREFALTEMRSDNAKSKSQEGDWAQFETFSVKSTNVAIVTYWRANYNVIFRANVVLKNIDAVGDATKKAQFDAEARFTRALAHFNLVRAYGDVPILDKVVTPTDADYQDYLDKNSVSDVLSFIQNDLEIAAANLPSQANTSFGRATSGAAKGILAKVYMTQGNYTAAQPILAQLIGDSQYALQPNYSDVFYSEKNSEIMFAIPYINDDVNESQDFSFEMTQGGQVSGLDFVTDNLAGAINPLDTERIPVLINPLDTKANGKFLSTSSNARLCGNDWIVLRLADVLLLNSEAIMAGQVETASVAAIKSYNLVRARSGMSTLAEDGTAKLTKIMLMDERRVELAFENHRLYDLIRFGEAQNVLSVYATSTGVTFSATDLILPIPQAEINVSSGLLIQNPGY